LFVDKYIIWIALHVGKDIELCTGERGRKQSWAVLTFVFGD